MTITICSLWIGIGFLLTYIMTVIEEKDKEDVANHALQIILLWPVALVLGLFLLALFIPWWLLCQIPKILSKTILFLARK
jgi:hypothetical protein